MSIPTIHTQRLALRPFEVSDAQVVQSLAGIGDVALTTQNIPHPYEDGMAEAWIASHRPDWDEGKLLTLAITEDSEGVVGAMGIRINSVQRCGEIGYWVGLPFWNRGYATESARAFLEFGFKPVLRPCPGEARNEDGGGSEAARIGTWAVRGRSDVRDPEVGVSH